MSDIIVLGTLCEAHHCPSCGVAYTVPSIVIAAQRQTGGYHYCANGHRLGWDEKGDTEFNRLRRERDRLKQEQARLEEGIASRDRELVAERNKAKRAAKRTAAGVCPCCTRNFVNMARHMKTKHPEFGTDNVVKLKA